mmetsp:Transcript_2052/g.8010  ORF Transcript_2052/g.8010 Transcript_2052/m.8010 type:complete len:221 (+) Transcript_2052:1345-2007(+)
MHTRIQKFLGRGRAGRFDGFLVGRCTLAFAQDAARGEYFASNVTRLLISNDVPHAVRGENNEIDIFGELVTRHVWFCGDARVFRSLEIDVSERSRDGQSRSHGFVRMIRDDSPAAAKFNLAPHCGYSAPFIRHRRLVVFGHGASASISVADDCSRVASMRCEERAADLQDAHRRAPVSPALRGGAVENFVVAIHVHFLQRRFHINVEPRESFRARWRRIL